jgi:hypothetical protein
MISTPEPELAGRRLLNGQYLATNEYIRSPNDHFFAIMQGDGHFCVYAGTGPADNRGAVWHTDRVGESASYVALLQDDGNFAVYRGTNVEDHTNVLWHAGCTGVGGKFQLVLGDDGRLFIFAGLVNPGNLDDCMWWSDRVDSGGPGYVPDREIGGRISYRFPAPFWQSFIPKVSGWLAALDLALEGTPEPHAILRLYQGEGVDNEPFLEQRITLPSSGDPARFVHYEIDLAKGPRPEPWLDAGKRYTLEILRPEGKDGPWLGIGDQPEPPLDRSSEKHLVWGMRLYRRPPAPHWSHPTG